MKDIPLKNIFRTPILWSSILCIMIYFSTIYFNNYTLEFYLGLTFASFKIINTILRKDPSLDEDFKNNYKDFLK